MYLFTKFVACFKFFGKHCSKKIHVFGIIIFDYAHSFRLAKVLRKGFVMLCVVGCGSCVCVMFQIIPNPVSIIVPNHSKSLCWCNHSKSMNIASNIYYKIHYFDAGSVFGHFGQQGRSKDRTAPLASFLARIRPTSMKIWSGGGLGSFWVAGRAKDVPMIFGTEAVSLFEKVALRAPSLKF